MVQTSSKAEGATRSKNLLKTKQQTDIQRSTAAGKSGTEIILLDGLDLEQLMSSLHVQKIQSTINDQGLLGLATHFFCTLDEFLQGVRKMPDTRMGILASYSEKIDLTPCLLAARELQDMATEYAFTHPVHHSQDIAKKQLASNFAGVTETFLFVSCAESAEAPMNKDKALVIAGKVVDTKNEMRGLLTQYSMVALPTIKQPRALQKAPS